MAARMPTYGAQQIPRKLCCFVVRFCFTRVRASSKTAVIRVLLRYNAANKTGPEPAGAVRRKLHQGLQRGMLPTGDVATVAATKRIHRPASAA